MGKQKTFRKDKWRFRRIDGSYGSFTSVRGNSHLGMDVSPERGVFPSCDPSLGRGFVTIELFWDVLLSGL